MIHVVLYNIVRCNSIYVYLNDNYTCSCSDPYVRIELNTIVGNVAIDSVLTKTKKKVNIVIFVVICIMIA